jgi:hypothetical protein
MQIPYDLEFVQNRPSVQAIAIGEPFPALRAGHPERVREQDAFDALLRWAHRLISRLEKR